MAPGPTVPQHPPGITLEYQHLAFLRPAEKAEQARRAIRRLTKHYGELSSQIALIKNGYGHVSAEDLLERKRELLQLGVEIGKRMLDQLTALKEVLNEECAAGSISQRSINKKHEAINRCFLEAQGALWRYAKASLQLQDPDAVRPMQPDRPGVGLAECLLPLYRGSNPYNKIRKRPSKWSPDVFQYYLGHWSYHNKSRDDLAWCHITGRWHKDTFVKASPIVPLFRDLDSMSEILFGTPCEPLERGQNALLLSIAAKHWFDSYKLVVIPANLSEVPIRRWRTEFLVPHIPEQIRDETVDGTELQFLGEKRPAARFLYFHFVMALIRCKDTHGKHWREIWARYHEQRPFPAPEPYMRRAILRALATYFAVPGAEMNLVESWIADHGFDTPLSIDDAQAREVARRVYDAVEIVKEKDETADSSGDEADSEWDEE